MKMEKKTSTKEPTKQITLSDLEQRLSALESDINNFIQQKAKNDVEMIRRIVREEINATPSPLRRLEMQNKAKNDVERLLKGKVKTK
jgi:hypothetical protein